MQAKCITNAVGLMFLKWYPLYKKKGWRHRWRILYRLELYLYLWDQVKCQNREVSLL